MVGSFLKDIMPNAVYLSSSDCDLTNQESVQKYFNHIKPDVVIHLAAKVGGITDNIACPADYFDENILMNTFVLKASKQAGVKQFIGILSTCIYPDKVDSYPMTEDKIHVGPPTYTNFSYGYAKRCMAVQIEAYNKQYGLSYNYLIPTNLYGEHDKFNDGSSHFVTALIKKIHEAKKYGYNKITLMGTGLPMRQFMYAKDFAKYIKECVEKNITDNLNISCDESISIKQIADIALKSCDAEHLLIEFDSDKPDGQYRKDVSNKKMMTIIPEFKITSLEDGIRQTYKKALELNKFDN